MPVAIALPCRGQSPAPAAPYSFTLLSGTLQQLSLAIDLIPARRLHANGRARSVYTAAQAALEKNLRQAVPGLLLTSERQPRNLAADFRLYRDLEAVEQVAHRISATGVKHGPKRDAAVLYRATQNLEAQLSQLADYLQSTAVQQQQIMQQVVQERAAAAAAMRNRPRHLVINNANRRHPRVVRRRVNRRRPLRHRILRHRPAARRKPVHRPSPSSKKKKNSAANPHSARRAG